jgi:hypothetical protein
MSNGLREGKATDMFGQAASGLGSSVEQGKKNVQKAQKIKDEINKNLNSLTDRILDSYYYFDINNDKFYVVEDKQNGYWGFEIKSDEVDDTLKKYALLLYKKEKQKFVQFKPQELKSLQHIATITNPNVIQQYVTETLNKYLQSIVVAESLIRRWKVLANIK